MKELSIEEKVKAYDEALERAKRFYNANTNEGYRQIFEDVFTELAESEDEKIRKALIDKIKRLADDECVQYGTDFYAGDYNSDQIVAWLEKQGDQKPVESNKEFEDFVRWFVKQRTDDYTLIPSDEDIHKWAIMILKHAKKCINEQKPKDNYDVCDTCDEQAGCVNPCPMKLVEQKPTDKIEPKFHEGDWVVYNNKHQSIYQVEKIEDGYYILRHTHGGTFRVCVLHDESLRLWTIQDAKDGDVLVASDGSIFLFKGTVDCACKHYVALTTDHVVKFNEGLEYYWETSRSVHPATKEQRDTLMKAIHNAGYEWDAEKKELKKIKQKPIDDKLQEFKDKLCELFQRFRWNKDGTLTNGDILEYVDGHIQELLAVANEQKPYGQREECFDCEFRCGNKCIGFCAMKRCEQKPTVPLDENGEPILTDFESTLFTAISCFWQSYNLGEEVNIAEFVKEYAPELLEAANKQQNPAWSEDDNKLIDSVIELIDGGALDRGEKDYFIEKLKSLKDRILPQPKQEWSEEE